MVGLSASSDTAEDTVEQALGEVVNGLVPQVPDDISAQGRHTHQSVLRATI